ncbi:cyclic nucleotide-binding domain-containing protein [bacterium]|nr:cyclic nucleotide-binding domain-containing protein [bacterium]
MDRLSSYERNLAPGEAVYKQGEKGREMYFVRKGRIKIFATNWGRETLLSTVDEGGFFGENALIDNMPRPHSAVAIEETELLVINEESFQTILTSNPVLKYIIEMLIQRLKEVSSLVYDSESISI